MTEEQVAFLALCVIVAGIIIGLICLIHYSKKIEYVRKNSIKLSKINNLNKQYNFNSLHRQYNISETYETKAKFDRKECSDYLYVWIYDNQEKLEALLEKADQNTIAYSKYKSSIDNILNSKKNDIFQDKKSYKKIEDNECSKQILNPVCKFIICVTLYYTSPQGRNSYYKNNSFDQSDLIYYLDMVKKDIIRKNSAVYQRTLMTESLRYDIMKRDHFRCVLCGATARDGVKLHVDHIIPVSKGGKTIVSNLRTLCDRCNLGKSDKYDESGPN